MGRRRNWDKIGEIVRKIKEHNLTYVIGAEQFGINVRDIYEYNKRIKKKKECADIVVDSESKGVLEGVEQISDKEQVENSSILPEEIQQIIVKYRNDHPDHGYKRIQDHLKSRHFLVVSRKHIRRVLKRRGLHKVCDSSFDRKDENSKKGSRRFEADYPRQLYQMDVTYVYITGIPVLYLVLIIDDYSRFCVAADLRRDQRGNTMIDVLHLAIEHYGKPRKLLTDQGRSFYTWSYESTVFQKYLDDMEIEHIVADPHSPQTIGKVERLNQTVKRELLQKVRFTSYTEAQRGIKDYFQSYNYDRPHQGIKGACPADRFHGIVGEIGRIESELTSKNLDFSRGYLIFKSQDHTISMIYSSEGVQVFLDGHLLRGGKVS